MSANLHQLIESLQSDNANSVRFCLEAGYPFAQTTALQNTALHHGAMSGVHAVALMIQAGGQEDVNARNSLGRTPLHVAANFGDIEVATLLVSQGSHIDQQDREGKAPRDLALERGEVQMVAALDGLIAEIEIDALLKSAPGRQKKASP